MKVNNTRDKDKKKKKQSVLEAQIFAIMQNTLKTAIDAAIDDVLKEWK